MDNSSEFTTDTVFSTREDLFNWAQNVARSLGYVIVTKKSKSKSKNGYVSKVLLMCDRGGIHKSKKTDNENTSSRERLTKKIGCPFELVGKYYKTIDVWRLSVKYATHNHEPAEFMEGYSCVMRLTDNENTLVADLLKQNVKPRDILTTLKKQNENNVSSLRTVYNASAKFRVAEQAGRSQMQVVMDHFRADGYDFEYLTNDITNELEELFFVHPISYMIWKAFPYVLFLDATYKTNKYNLPFLQIVGVTSTNQTFSIAFVFLHKEKKTNFVWALTNLKMMMNDDFSPRVIVTDRDLALMNACKTIFPEAKQLLCTWHISQAIVLKMATRVKPLELRERVRIQWSLLVESVTQDTYMQNYEYLEALLIDYPDILDYMNKVWLNKYGRMFLAIWTNMYLHFGNPTNNRVESQHAKLKLLLDSAQSNIDRFVYFINQLVQLQHTTIKESLERSRIFRRTKSTLPQFQPLWGLVSKNGLDLIFEEINRSNGLELDYENCGCKLRSCFGLPCAHELADLFNAGLPIPLESIDMFWRKLDLSSSLPEDDDIPCEEDVEKFQEVYAKQTPFGKNIFLKMIRGIYNKKTDHVREPAIQRNTRGRPTSKEKQPKATQFDPQSQDPHRHSYSNTSKGFDPPSQDPHRHSSYTNQTRYSHPLLGQIPPTFHPYVAHIKNVKGDGNCGFRAIANSLGYDEEEYLQIRCALLDEFHSHYEGYLKIMDVEWLEQILHSLSFPYACPAPQPHWMLMPDTGFMIASKFDVIVNFLSPKCSITFFPLWSAPQHFLSITLALVNDNHYVSVELQGEYPMAPTHPHWVLGRSDCASGWETPYVNRQKVYRQLNPSTCDPEGVDVDD